ncbi:MAG: heavy metal transporter [Ferruginibacter sp.]|nr:heavy metal transporter [Ferruginibacter sp.]
MRKLFFLLAIIYSPNAGAQLTKVSLQASGLTCSMCSNSVYKSLKTIPFVDKIEPNIKTSTFEITFKQNSNVNFNMLRDKVEDAGYAYTENIKDKEYVLFRQVLLP